MIGETITQEEFNKRFGIQSGQPRLFGQTEQPKQGINFLQRLRLGFGGPEAQEQKRQLEEQAGLRGKFDIGDVADIAGGVLPIAGGILGAAGGTLFGTPVGAIPGAAIGTMAGEATKQAIGRALGVREEVPLTKEATELGLAGGLTFLGGKLGGYVISRIPKFLGIFTGESDEVIREALKNPKITDTALKQGDETLRRAIQIGSQKTIEAKNSFLQGAKDAFQKLMTAVPEKMKIAPNIIINDFKNLLESQKVKITKKGLDFTISPIKANPGEISKIQATYDALLGWKDWSVGGVRSLKQLVGSLTKFADEAGIPSKSPTLGRFYHQVDEQIRAKLPLTLRRTYDDLNKNFADNIDLFDDMIKAFNSGDPFTRIANALGTNKDSLRQVLQFYEKQTGEKIFGVLAGRELAAERKAAFGFLNPRQWLDFFIDPKVQARLVTLYGRGVQKIAPPITKGYEQYRRLFGVKP